MDIFKHKKLAITVSSIAISTSIALIAGTSGAFAATGSSGVPSGTPSSSASTQQAKHHHVHHHAKRGKGTLLRSLTKPLAAYLKLSPAQLRKDMQSGQTLDQIATTQGFTQSALLAEMQSIVNSHIQTAVQNGHLTQTAATAREQKIDAKLPALAAKVESHGKHKHGKHKQKSHHPSQMGSIIKESSTLLKMTPRALVADLKGGQSISQVAQSKGIAAQTFTQEVEAALSEDRQGRSRLADQDLTAEKIIKQAKLSPPLL